MSTDPAYFTSAEDGTFEPTQFAQGHWGDDHLDGPAVDGPAVVGLLARTLEGHCGSIEFMPSRRLRLRDDTFSTPSLNYE